MKLLTHTAVGMFSGAIFYYLLNLDVGFILLAGFAAFLPDIDWRMQYSWRLGNVHRKVLHNVWVMGALAGIVYFLFRSPVLVLGVVVGFMSHLIADCFTVEGVYWLYPIGRKTERFHVKGSLSMSRPETAKIEGYIQIVLFTLTGFLFLVKQIEIDVFSMEGLITLAVMLAVGFYLFKTLGKVIKRTIRRMGL